MSFSLGKRAVAVATVEPGADVKDILNKKRPSSRASGGFRQIWENWPSLEEDWRRRRRCS